MGPQGSSAGPPELQQRCFVRQPALVEQLAAPTVTVMVWPIEGPRRVGGRGRAPGRPAEGRRAFGSGNADAQRGGGFNPVLGNFALGRPQSDLTLAYGVIQRILDGVFRVDNCGGPR